MDVGIASGLQPRLSRKLLRDSGFEAFFGTQFFSGFYGHFYKLLISLLVAFLQMGQQPGSHSLVFAGAALVLSFLLFSGTAGEPTAPVDREGPQKGRI